MLGPDHTSCLTLLALRALVNIVLPPPQAPVKEVGRERICFVSALELASCRENIAGSVMEPEAAAAMKLLVARETGGSCQAELTLRTWVVGRALAARQVLVEVE